MNGRQKQKTKEKKKTNKNRRLADDCNPISQMELSKANNSIQIKFCINKTIYYTSAHVS